MTGPAKNAQEKKEEALLDLESYPVRPEAVAFFSEKIARRYLAVPLRFEGQSLVVALADPSDVLTLDNLRVLTGREIIPVGALKSSIETAINHLYRKTEIIEEEVGKVVEGEEDQTESENLVVAEEAPVIKLAHLIIGQAIRDSASDIHLEPQEKDLRVRYRIDGILQEIMNVPKRIQAALISRFKIMASMDVAERRKPQDGHCDLIVGGRAFDFRVATLPTIYGERVVLRVLEKESILMDLNDLGFLSETLERFKLAFNRPHGTILVTGPTGSGKSTTLYATLNVLNTSEKNIVTIEDPVEYRLPGINQIQVNNKINLTFSKGLRATLRADPDIVMVGEIRDRETAQIAVEAALTGHLVFSTLHTNDAPSTIIRLTEMGIEPFLISSALTSIQAQRLARRLCERCKQPKIPPLELIEEFKIKDGSNPLYFPKGCSSCNNTGYKGRVGIYEVMLMSERIRQLAVERASSEEIKRVAKAEGMKTLFEDGVGKVELGLTSLEEIMRVIA